MTNNNLSLKKIAAATGLFLGAFALSAFAGDWTPAGCAAPGCNTAAPINVSNSAQYKEGSLAIGKSSAPTAGFDLDVDGNANLTGSLITSGISISGLTNTLSLKVGGTNANSSGYVLTNDGTGLAEWRAATGGGDTSFDSSFCYALRAGRFTRDGAFSGYYLKGVTKSTDGNWDAHAGVYCLMKGNSDSRMTASVIQTLVDNGYLVVNSGGPVVGKTYNQIADDCKNVDARPYAYGGTVTCPLKDVFAN